MRCGLRRISGCLAKQTEQSSLPSPLSQVAADSKVSVLIDQDRAMWKSKLVQQHFLPHEAEIIIGIPLSIRCPVDRIIWAHTRSGMFTTSSSYKLLVSYESMSNAGSSNPKVQRKFWKSIWQLRVPHIIKHFFWRACNNALPTMVNLHWRHIVSTVNSKLCNDHPKDTLHAV